MFKTYILETFQYLTFFENLQAHQIVTFGIIAQLKLLTLELPYGPTSLELAAHATPSLYHL